MPRFSLLLALALAACSGDVARFAIDPAPVARVDALIDRLSSVFRAVGYEGASLARLAEAEAAEPTRNVERVARRPQTSISHAATA